MIFDSEYIQGGGLVSPCRNIFYLKIPKNASTYLSNVLLANNWEEWNLLEDPIPVQKTIVFIRDPLDRWISGFATYAALHLFGFGYGSDHFVSDYNDLVQRIIFNQVIFDDHTNFQVNYIEQVKNLNPIYFRHNHNIIKQLNSFLGYELDATSIIDNIEKNQSAQNYDTKQISNYFTKIINNNPDLKARIITSYEKDYNFINNVEFYNDPR